MRRLDLEQLGPKINSCQMLRVFAPICCGAGIHVFFYVFLCWFCISNSTANVIGILCIMYILYLFYDRFIVMLWPVLGRALEFWWFLFGVLSTSWEVCNTAKILNIFEYKTLYTGSKHFTNTCKDPSSSLFASKFGRLPEPQVNQVGLFVDGLKNGKWKPSISHHGSCPQKVLKSRKGGIGMGRNPPG